MFNLLEGYVSFGADITKIERAMLDVQRMADTTAAKLNNVSHWKGGTGAGMSWERSIPAQLETSLAAIPTHAAAATGAIDKLAGAGAKAWSMLKYSTYLLPGIGIAGAIGLIVDGTVTLIGALSGYSDAQKRAATADEERTAALKRNKEAMDAVNAAHAETRAGREEAREKARLRGDLSMDWEKPDPNRYKSSDASAAPTIEQQFDQLGKDIEAQRKKLGAIKPGPFEDIARDLLQLKDFRFSGAKYAGENPAAAAQAEARERAEFELQQMAKIKPKAGTLYAEEVARETKKLADLRTELAGLREGEELRSKQQDYARGDAEIRERQVREGEMEWERQNDRFEAMGVDFDRRADNAAAMNDSMMQQDWAKFVPSDQFSSQQGDLSGVSRFIQGLAGRGVNEEKERTDLQKQQRDALLKIDTNSGEMKTGIQQIVAKLDLGLA